MHGLQLITRFFLTLTTSSPVTWNGSPLMWMKWDPDGADMWDFTRINIPTPIYDNKQTRYNPKNPLTSFKAGLWGSPVQLRKTSFLPCLPLRVNVFTSAWKHFNISANTDSKGWGTHQERDWWYSDTSETSYGLSLPTCFPSSRGLAAELHELRLKKKTGQRPLQNFFLSGQWRWWHHSPQCPDLTGNIWHFIVTILLFWYWIIFAQNN